MIEAGATVHEHSRVRALHTHAQGVTVETGGGRVRAGAAVLAINAATRGFKPLRGRVSVTSSHIVLTEPVPDVLESDRLDRRRVHHRRAHLRALLPDHP